MDASNRQRKNSCSKLSSPGGSSSTWPQKASSYDAPTAVDSGTALASTTSRFSTRLQSIECGMSVPLHFHKPLTWSCRLLMHATLLSRDWKPISESKLWNTVTGKATKTSATSSHRFLRLEARRLSFISTYLTFSQILICKLKFLLWCVLLSDQKCDFLDMLRTNLCRLGKEGIMLLWYLSWQKDAWGVQPIDFERGRLQRFCAGICC